MCVFLFGSFFTVCHPYIDVHFLKCFFCDFLDTVVRVIAVSAQTGTCSWFIRPNKLSNHLATSNNNCIACTGKYIVNLFLV